jgi:NTP pyrophosphatase (non-canonical NTP hydrolase)
MLDVNNSGNLDVAGVSELDSSLFVDQNGIEYYSWDVAQAVNTLTTVCHGRSKDAGWWNDLQTGKPLTLNVADVGLKLMLIVSEVAEAMEGHRKGLKDDKLTHRAAVEVELADAIIRICDMAGGMGLDLGGALAEKLEYNKHREDHKIENRKKEGGKKY